MEFRPLIIGNGSRGFNHEQRLEERNLLSQLENGTDQEENVPGVDCTLKLGFPYHETPAQTPQSQPSSSSSSSSVRSTPQQQVRSNDQILHGGVANLYGSMAAMNNIPPPGPPPPPPFSWPPVQQHVHPSNYVPRYGGGVPLYPPPPPLMAAPPPPESSRTSNVVYPTYNYNIPLPSFANQRYVGHVLRPRGGEEANHPARKCMACNTSSTPLWRNGPGGPKSLCNACGIRFKKEERKSMGIEPQSRQKGSGSRHPEGSSRST